MGNELPIVFVIVINYNGLSNTIECVKSLTRSSYQNLRIVIIDNTPRKNDAVELKEAFGDAIIVISNEANYGFAKGSNIGIDYAMKEGAEYIFLLNNDARVESKSIEYLLEALQSDPEVGIVGPKIYFDNHPGGNDIIWFAGGRLIRTLGQPFHRGLNEIDIGKYDHQEDVDFITGCALMIRRDVIEKIGKFDEDFFIYFEDLDFNCRASDSGYRITYVPKARIWHKVSSSTGQMSPLYLFLFTRNRFIFVKKNTGILGMMSFIPYYLSIRVMYTILRYSLRCKWGHVNSVLEGFLSGLLNWKISASLIEKYL